MLAAYAKIELANALRRRDLADDPYFRRHAAPLLPEAAGGTLRRRAGHPPAAPRDHRHRGGQRHDQHGRHHLRLPRHGGNLGQRGRRSPAPSWRCAKSTASTTIVAALNELPPSFPTEHWSTIHLDMRRLLDRAVRWLDQPVAAPAAIDDVVQHLRPDRPELGAQLVRITCAAADKRPGGVLAGAGRRLGGARSSWASAGPSCSKATRLLDIAEDLRHIEEPVDEHRRRSTTRCTTASAWTPCWNGSPRCRARTAGRRWPVPRCAMTCTPRRRT